MTRALLLAAVAALLLVPLAAANPATDLVNGARNAAARELSKAQRSLGDAAPGGPPDPGTIADQAHQAYGQALDALDEEQRAALDQAHAAQDQAEQGFYAAWYALLGRVRGAAGL